MRFALSLALTMLFVIGCSSTPNKPAPAATTSADSADLTWEEAQARFNRVSDVHYQLNVSLLEDAEQFTGNQRITFNLKDVGQPLRIDFFEGQVSALNVNGQKIAAEAKKRYWIELPAASLKVGLNIVDIAYIQDYSHQGQGLHKFVDPETKQVFLYSQFESYDANRFMPCFDQPNLRAVFNLTVEAPATWQVISTTREAAVRRSGPRRQWIFPATAPIATYLFSLHAGPFKVWNDKFEDIPLRLFVRPAMAKYINPQEWFTYTKQGLKFYNSYFAYRYPFKKYDQLIVPEFNAGAMENVAAVTFSERYTWRGAPTREQHRGLAGTLLHEMAHMWFGDIVTMNWWNDLWLNESFATFMSALCMSQATEFKESWQEFFAGDKTWAYWEDGLVTTHPIEASVHSVKDAFANFDGITYGKGASVLKQLWAYMGADNFQKGLQKYIPAHAMGNATLNQFIEALQTQTDHDLKLWAKRWLQQSGTDKLAVHWNCNGDSLDRITVTSTPGADREFRPQALQVALFGDSSGHISQPTVVDVSLTKPSQDISGHWACPSFVYPNYQDLAFALTSLDPVSLKYAEVHLSDMQDDLLRTMVWADLWQMVRDTEMPLQRYLTVLSLHFSRENNELLLGKIVETIGGTRGERSSVINYWPQNSEKEIQERTRFIGQMEEEFLIRMNAAKAGSDEQKFWFDVYVSLAHTPKAMKQLAAWAHQPQVAPGFTLDIDRRWSVVRQLSRYEQPNVNELLGELKKQDPSERGNKNAMSVEAVQPKLDVKQKWVDILKEPKPKVSFSEARAVLGSLFPVEQDKMATRFQSTYFDYLKKNGDSEDEVFVTSVARNMAPLDCEAKNADQVREFLRGSARLSPSVAKAVKVNLQEDERCQRIRAFSALE